MSRRRLDADRGRSIPQVRSRLLDQLEGPERYSLFAHDVARTFELSLEDARAALLAIGDPHGWIAGAQAGTRMRATPALAARGVVIAELAVGIEIPVHAHRQREITLVLDGALADDSAHVHGPGAVIDMPIGSEHAISVVGDHDCLAVFSRRV